MGWINADIDDETHRLFNHFQVDFEGDRHEAMSHVIQKGLDSEGYGE